MISPFSDQNANFPGFPWKEVNTFVIFPTQSWNIILTHYFTFHKNYPSFGSGGWLYPQSSPPLKLVLNCTIFRDFMTHCKKEAIFIRIRCFNNCFFRMANLPHPSFACHTLLKNIYTLLRISSIFSPSRCNNPEKENSAGKTRRSSYSTQTIFSIHFVHLIA